MVIRELKNGSCLVSTQEDHAELSAQFAAHWRNERFSRLRPYETMVLATTYHDSGYREWEGSPPIHLTKGRPYAHRETIPSFEAVELEAYARNVEWLQACDRYASLLVSMHRSGLWANRYDVFTSPAGRMRERSGEVVAAKIALEAQQQEEEKKFLGSNRADFADELWFNFRALQIFDLLSLYFCCDGYVDDEHFKEDLFAPHPFDVAPLNVAVRARLLSPGKVASEAEGLAAYHRAPRRLLSFNITD